VTLPAEWRRAAEEFRALLRTDPRYPEGASIAGVTEIMAATGVSRNVAARALQHLADLGELLPRAGHHGGSVVMPEPPEVDVDVLVEQLQALADSFQRTAEKLRQARRSTHAKNREQLDQNPHAMRIDANKIT